MTGDAPDAAASPPSEDYYALLFTPTEHREIVGALLAIRGELTRIPTDQPNTALATLGWWQEELQRLAGGEPRHPLTQSIAQGGADCASLAGRLAEIVGAVHQDLTGRVYDDPQALRHYCEHHGGALQVLVARALGAEEEDALAYGRCLGVAIRMSEIAGDEATAPETAREFAAQAISELDNALDALPPGQRARQRTGLVLAALHRKRLEALRDGANRYPGGFGKLWTAWRAARRAIRGRLP